MRLLSVWENGAKDQNIGLLPHYGGVSGCVPAHHPPVTWEPSQGEEACLQGEAVRRPVGPASQDHVPQWQESFHQERCSPKDWTKWRQHRVRWQVLSVLLYSWGALPSLLTTSKRHKVPFSNIFCRVPHFHIYLTNLKMLKKQSLNFCQSCILLNIFYWSLTVIFFPLTSVLQILNTLLTFYQGIYRWIMMSKLLVF